MVDNQTKGLSESLSAIANIRKNPERYRSLGLLANPFPGGGLAPSNPQVEPLPQIRDQILQFLQRFLESSSSNGMVLLGNYGAGKTYHLNYIHTILKGSPFNIRIVHIVDPGIHPYHVIRSILLSMGEEEVASRIWNIIGPYMRSEYENEEKSGFFEGMIKSTNKKASGRVGERTFRLALSQLNDEHWSDHRLFLRELEKQLQIDRERLTYAVMPILMDPENRNFVTQIKQIAEDLVGVCLYDGVPALERWKSMTEGVGPGAIQAGNEREFLTALLHLLKISGAEYFVLLLDEFEKVPQLERMTEKDARLYLDTLRMLIDAGSQELPFAYILASNAEAWKLAVDKMTSLEDRLTKVNLPLMIDDEIASALVLGYLQQVRLSDFESTNTLHPFPENFPASVALNSRRTARQLVKLCHNLIELAVERNAKIITDEMINEVLMITDDNDGVPL